MRGNWLEVLCIEKTYKAKLFTIGNANNFSRESVIHSHENIDINIIVRHTIIVTKGA